MDGQAATKRIGCCYAAHYHLHNHFYTIADTKYGQYTAYQRFSASQQLLNETHDSMFDMKYIGTCK
jgi:hypothetical protein